MSRNYNQPYDWEKNPVLEACDEISRTADQILEVLGGEKKDESSRSHTLTATLAISESSLAKVLPDTLPTIKISKPIGGFAERAAWSYEITYGMQHERHSRHIAIYKDEDNERFPAVIGRYDFPAVEQHLTVPQAEAIIADLNQVLESASGALAA